MVQRSQKTARLTEHEIELDEYVMEKIDEELRWLAENLESKPRVTITYFVPDEKKEGGAFVQKTGYVKKLDSYQRQYCLRMIPVSIWRRSQKFK